MFKTQLNLELLHHEISNTIVDQRSIDGYINATLLCAAAGKKFHNYKTNASTQEYLKFVSLKTGIPVDNGNQGLSLIESRQGAPETGGGSWINPKIAVHLGMWLSPEFAWKVSEWIEPYLAGKAVNITPTASIPFHLERYLRNDPKVPPGHFSILQESTLNLTGHLHMLGFDIPKGMVPDISIGKAFCQFLRDVHGTDTKLLVTYYHDYGDGRPLVQAYAYPNKHLADYRSWFREKWLPIQGIQYFKRKDPKCIAYVAKLPALAPPAQSTPLKISIAA